MILRVLLAIATIHGGNRFKLSRIVFFSLLILIKEPTTNMFRCYYTTCLNDTILVIYFALFPVIHKRYLFNKVGYQGVSLISDNVLIDVSMFIFVLWKLINCFSYFKISIVFLIVAVLGVREAVSCHRTAAVSKAYLELSCSAGSVLHVVDAFYVVYSSAIVLVNDCRPDRPLDCSILMSNDDDYKREIERKCEGRQECTVETRTQNVPSYYQCGGHKTGRPITDYVIVNYDCVEAAMHARGDLDVIFIL